MKPIAMKCSKEQWEAIKPKLKNVEIHALGSFKSYSYLVNNCIGYLGRLTNILDDWKGDYNRTVYEEWNEDIFLEACGIKTEVDEFKKGDYIVSFSKQFLSKDMNFQLPEKWACKLTLENKDRFEAAYNILVDGHYFYFNSIDEYYNFRANRTETLEGCTEITLEQMEQAAGINAAKGKDTSNVAFDISSIDVYEFPVFKKPMPVMIYNEMLIDEQAINLTKPTLNRPKTKQLKANLIKPIKPVKS